MDNPILKENYSGSKKRKIERVGYADGGGVQPAATPDSSEPPGLDEFLGSSGGGTSPNSPNLTSEPEGLDDFIASEKYGTPTEQFKAGLEGAAQGIAGPLAPMAEQAFGVDPEAIRGRAEANPGTHAIGEAAGFGGSMLSGIGEGALIAKLGAKVAGTGILSKIGAGALQTAAMGMSDELSKTVNQDPNQSIQSAASHIGLSALLGGAASGSLGAVNSLWKSSLGNKASEFLGGFRDKGIEMMNGTPVIADATEAAALGSKASRSGAAAMEQLLSLPKQMAGTLGGSLGASAGEAVLGHSGAVAGGLAGYNMGKNLLGPTFDRSAKAIIKPLLESNFHAEGAKATLDYIRAVGAGQNMLNTAAQNLFNDKDVLPESKQPDQRDLDKLNQQLKVAQTNPESLTNVASNAIHYVPDHGVAAGALVGRAATYLNSIRTDNNPANPLDTKIPQSPSQKATYDRQLAIAQQPISILNHIKIGNITPEDIKTFNTIYPDLHTDMVQRINEHMVNTISKGNTIPYQTRMGLSMFMGQPLDSTMTPQGIMAAQPIPAPPPETTTSGKTKSLTKSAQQAATPLQAREMNRTSSKE